MGTVLSQSAAARTAAGNFPKSMACARGKSSSEKRGPVLPPNRPNRAWASSRDQLQRQGHHGVGVADGPGRDEAVATTHAGLASTPFPALPSGLLVRTTASLGFEALAKAASFKENVVVEGQRLKGTGDPGISGQVWESSTASTPIRLPAR